MGLCEHVEICAGCGTVDLRSDCLGITFHYEQMRRSAEKRIGGRVLFH